MLYEQSLKEMLAANQTYGALIGKQSPQYSMCLYEMAKLKFLQHHYEEALTVSVQCLKNFQFLLKNNENAKTITKIELLIKTIHKITNNTLKQMNSEEEIGIRQEYKGLLDEAQSN